MPDERARARHRALALALRDAPRSAPHALALHFRLAGDADEAARWLSVAIERAEATLAFEQAVSHHRALRALGRGRDVEGARRFAEALARAGRGAEAAGVFLEAAACSAGASRDELERRAMVELLHAGELEEGYRVARPLLSRHGVWVPRSRLVCTALGLLLVAWLYLTLRRQFAQPARQRLSPEQLARFDLMHALAIVTMSTDPPMFTYVAARAALLAPGIDDPVRRATTLAHASGMLGAALSSEQTRRVQGALDSLADRHDDPLVRARARFNEMTTAAMSGHYRRSVENARACQRAFEQCPGTSSELDVARAWEVWGLCHLGELGEVVELASRLHQRARERGARWMESAMSGSLSVLRYLARDQVDLAVAETERSPAGWPIDGLVLPRLWYFDARGYLNLYAGRPAELGALIEHAWPRLRAAGALLVPYIDVHVRGHRARARLAMAERAARTEPARARSLALAALADARVIRRRAVRSAPAHAALLSAGAHRLLGDDERARHELERALDEADEAELALHAAVARHRLASYRSGEARAALLAAFERYASEQGLVRPERFVEMVAPGFGARPEA